MPQFDFRQLFPSDPTATHPRKESLGRGDELTDQYKFIPPLQLSRANWTNIAFVVAACLGALISAVYLFNGAELFRQAAMWPGELLYSPPHSAPRAYPSNALPQPLPGQTVSGVIPPTENAAARDTGDPFSSTSRLLNLNQTPLFAYPRTNPSSSSTGLTAPQAPTVLNQLGVPAPGGDALSRALTDGAINSAQSKLAAATNTANAVQGSSQGVISSRVRNARASHRVASSAHAAHARQLTKRSTQTARTTAAKTLPGHSTVTKSAAQSTSAGSVVSSAPRSNIGQDAAGMKGSISPGQQLRVIGGAGGMGAGGGHLLGRPGGR